MASVTDGKKAGVFEAFLYYYVHRPEATRCNRNEFLSVRRPHQQQQQQPVEMGYENTVVLTAYMQGWVREICLMKSHDEITKLPRLLCMGRRINH
jgi:hypothetical protein